MSPASAGALAVGSRTASAASSARQREVMASSAVVPDAVEGAGEIVGHDDRAVGKLGDVDRPTEIFAVLGEPAFGEHLGLVGGAVLLEAGEHHARADRGGAVPRAVLSGEDAAAVFLREHAAG